MIPRPALAIVVVLSGCSLIPGLQAHDEAEARRLLTPVLLDAPSARFEGVTRAMGRSGNGTEGAVICGQVNAKNRMGAFVGFRRFVAVPSEEFAAVSPDADPQSTDDDRAQQAAFDGLWPACSGGRQRPA